MSTATLAIPVFDADNHLYETKDAFTKFLPERYKGAVDYVDVRGRTKIVDQGDDQRLHPQPHLRRGRRARGHGGVLPARQPRRQGPASHLRRADPITARRSASPSRACS